MVSLSDGVSLTPHVAASKTCGTSHSTSSSTMQTIITT